MDLSSFGSFTSRPSFEDTDVRYESNSERKLQGMLEQLQLLSYAEGEALEAVTERFRATHQAQAARAASRYRQKAIDYVCECGLWTDAFPHFWAEGHGMLPPGKTLRVPSLDRVSPPPSQRENPSTRRSTAGSSSVSGGARSIPASEMSSGRQVTSDGASDTRSGTLAAAGAGLRVDSMASRAPRVVTPREPESLVVHGRAMKLVSAQQQGDGSREEILAADGDTDEIIAVDSSPEGLPPDLSHQIIIKKNQRRENAGCPPLSPKRAQLHGVRWRLFDAIWEEIIESLSPILSECAQAETKAAAAISPKHSTHSAMSSAASAGEGAAPPRLNRINLEGVQDAMGPISRKTPPPNPLMVRRRSPVDGGYYSDEEVPCEVGERRLEYFDYESDVSMGAVTPRTSSRSIHTHRSRTAEIASASRAAGDDNTVKFTLGGAEGDGVVRVDGVSMARPRVTNGAGHAGIDEGSGAYGDIGALRPQVTSAQPMMSRPRTSYGLGGGSVGGTTRPLTGYNLVRPNVSFMRSGAFPGRPTTSAGVNKRLKGGYKRSGRRRGRHRRDAKRSQPTGLSMRMAAFPIKEGAKLVWNGDLNSNGMDSGPGGAGLNYLFQSWSTSRNTHHSTPAAFQRHGTRPTSRGGSRPVSRAGSRPASRGGSRPASRRGRSGGANTLAPPSSTGTMFGGGGFLGARPRSSSGIDGSPLPQITGQSLVRRARRGGAALHAGASSGVAAATTATYSSGRLSTPPQSSLASSGSGSTGGTTRLPPIAQKGPGGNAIHDGSQASSANVGASGAGGLTAVTLGYRVHNPRIMTRNPSGGPRQWRSPGRR